MTGEYRRVFASLLVRHSPAELLARLTRKHVATAQKVPSGSKVTDVAIDGRWAALPLAHAARRELLDAQSQAQAHRYAANVENFIGTVKVPVGIIGPLRINGTHAQQDYFVPLATTEATLVASYGRGAKLITSAGGCSALGVNEGMARSPGFAFQALHEAGEFAAWVLAAFRELAEIGAGTSRYARLQSVRVSIEGNHVYVIFDFTLGTRPVKTWSRSQRRRSVNISTFTRQSSRCTTFLRRISRAIRRRAPSRPYVGAGEA